jgi:hypothetical protein
MGHLYPPQPEISYSGVTMSTVRISGKNQRRVMRIVNPVRISEDLADYLISEERLRKEKPIPLKKVLQRYGYRLER